MRLNIDKVMQISSLSGCEHLSVSKMSLYITDALSYYEQSVFTAMHMC